MKKTIVLMSFVVLFMLPNISTAQGVGVIEKNIMPLPDKPAEEWWLESWRQGWEYTGKSTFRFSSKAKSKNTEEIESARGLLAWIKKEFGGAKGAVIGSFEIQISGAASVYNNVIEKNESELLIARYYQKVDSTRKILRKPVQDKVPDVMEKIMDPDRLQRAVNAVRNVLRPLIAWISGEDNVVVTEIVGDKLENFVGPIADSYINDSLKKHGLSKNPEGGIEINPDGTFAKKYLGERINDAMHIALKLTEEFSSSVFAISASSAAGNLLNARDIRDPRVLEEYQSKLRATDGGREAALKCLRDAIARSREVDALVKGTLQRETFILTKEIFDYKERKPGDKWVINAEVFNNMLHPDLKGGFKGRAIIEYVTDDVVTSAVNKERYPARILDVVFSSHIDGRNMISDFEYAETGGDGFCAKFEPDTVATLFIDKNGNYLRQADIKLKSSDSSKMPQMYLTKGLEAEGRSVMEVDYRCSGAPIE